MREMNLQMEARRARLEAEHDRPISPKVALIILALCGAVMAVVGWTMQRLHAAGLLS
jgi:hypothetical protein